MRIAVSFQAADDQEQNAVGDIHQPELLVIDGENEILDPASQRSMFLPRSRRVSFGTDFFGGNRNAVGHDCLFQGSKVSQDRLHLLISQFHVRHQAPWF